MNNSCGWCAHTSAQIDSLEFYVETLKKENRALKRKLRQYEQPVSVNHLFGDIDKQLEALTIIHKTEAE